MNAPENIDWDLSDTKLLRRALGAFATGVAVVTTGGSEPHGMTANSFTSVSLDPPIVLVCIERSAHMNLCLRAICAFGISILAAPQEDVARHFADPFRKLGAAQFENLAWFPGPSTGVPLISGALASFECELGQSHECGDHTIFTGRLVSIDRRMDDDALVFFNGRFRLVETDSDGVRV